MIEVKVLICILFMHWIADFIMQTDYMAQNKSKCNKALGLHIVAYGIGLLPLYLCFNFTIEIFFLWLFLNMFAHRIIDYVTSRINSKLWEKKEVHWFFVSVGFDQFLHAATLIYTYYYFTIIFN